MVRISDNDTDLGVTSFVHYDSISDVLEYAKPENCRFAGNRRTITEGIWGNWGQTWLDYRNQQWFSGVLQNGDPETIAQIERLKERITSSSPVLSRDQVRRKRRRGQDWGDEMDSDRYLARDPMLWDRTDRIAQPSRTVTIAVNLSIACMFERKNLLSRGAAVAALSDWLSGNGYSVEIRAVTNQGSFTNKGDAISQIVIKNARTPMDVSSLATSLCEIVFYRAYVLAGQSAAATDQVGWGLGYPQNITPEHQKTLGIDFVSGTELLNEEKSIAWLEKTVSEISST